MSSSPKMLRFAPGIWRRLMWDLRIRGQGRRESGAFLLARRNDPKRVVREWLAYDDLDPGALNRDYIRLEPAAFCRLWEWCDQQRLQVIADVHTHPFGPEQSSSDRAFPMISFAGHIALIAPRFAQGEPKTIDVSYSVYRGSGDWATALGEAAASKIIAP